jgi:hypothetical protein
MLHKVAGCRMWFPVLKTKEAEKVVSFFVLLVWFISATIELQYQEENLWFPPFVLPLWWFFRDM